MEFPVWHFVGIGSGLIIGIVSVLHVFVAQFAVGGGIYLVWMERKAHRDGAPEILQWLERHTHFFLLLTMVFGGLSGVGIWFTMSVVNPGATSMLIHNFVFFWAAEWGLFLLEVVSLLAYYSTYAWSRSGRMSPEAHMRIGIVYACAGFLSLVLINGIITFMLTPGQGLSTGNVWLGFFNPTYWPSVVVRLGICLILAGMFALFTAPRIASAEARRIAVRVSGLWIILPFFLLLGGSVWYFMALPPDRQEAILNRASDIHPSSSHTAGCCPRSSWPGWWPLCGPSASASLWVSSSCVRGCFWWAVLNGYAKRHAALGWPKVICIPMG